MPHPRGCGFIFMETEKRSEIRLKILTSLDESGKVKQKVLDYIDHPNAALDLDKHKRIALNEFEYDRLLNKILERVPLNSLIYEVVR